MSRLSTVSLTTQPQSPHSGHHDPLQPECGEPVLLVTREGTVGGVVLAPARVVLAKHVAGIEVIAIVTFTGIEVIVTDSVNIATDIKNLNVTFSAIYPQHVEISRNLLF